MNARRLLSLVAAGALLAGCAGQPEMQTIVKSPEQIEAELRDIEACEKLREGKADDYLRPNDRCDNLPTTTASRQWFGNRRCGSRSRAPTTCTRTGRSAARGRR